MRLPWALICVLAVAAALGCQAEYAVPQSAQAGSTVVIPLMAGGDTVIGYGGVEKDGVTPVVTDSQRGMLVYHLDSPDGFALITRGTSAVLPDAASPKANNSSVNAVSLSEGWAVSQVVSLVDIPANAPVGPHPLYVTRDVPGQAPISVDLPEQPTLTILPNTVSAGGVDYTPDSTPFSAYSSSLKAFADLSPYAHLAVPNPQVRIQLSQPVWAAEVRILYPVGVINVEDALEPPLSRVDHLASVWFQDNAPNGQLTLNAVATQTAFQTLSFVFTLQNSVTPLKLSNVVPVVAQAWDKNGNPISGVSVTSTQIF